MVTRRQGVNTQNSRASASKSQKLVLKHGMDVEMWKFEENAAIADIGTRTIQLKRMGLGNSV